MCNVNKPKLESIDNIVFKLPDVIWDPDSGVVRHSPHFYSPGEREEIIVIYVQKSDNSFKPLTIKTGYPRSDIYVNDFVAILDDNGSILYLKYPYFGELKDAYEPIRDERLLKIIIENEYKIKEIMGI